MKTRFWLALFILPLMAGCASGPTHDYYNPTVVGAKYKGPVTIAQVDDLKTEVEKCQQQGYVVIGSTRYSGKYPETVELKAQAKRVGANHVVYHCTLLPAQPGAWHFSFGGWGGNGGT